ncbi:MAG: alkaline phosphatase [Clostridia bacterium]
MRNKLTKLTSLAVAIVLALMCFTGCTAPSIEDNAEAAGIISGKTPKYIFLFIGDGMSYPQIQSTSYYLNAIENGESEILRSSSRLGFMDFPVAGSAQTYDSTSFCPDSASTATSISTGNKTYSGTINMDETKTTAYETIAEKLHKQKGYKVGIVTSVNLNHATPAAFYAHQASRNSYYEIGLELIESGFEYFAGGGLLQTMGKDGDKESLYVLAENTGYKVIKTQAEAAKLTAADGRAIVIDEHLADADAMNYELDSADDDWKLSDYVKKGIEVLDNDNGFFMMVEGGKIDWACHANDAAAAINDTVALSNAVDQAVEFYNQHPDETLILVTGDHETGGLTIGFSGTNYDTFLQNMENQKISFVKFDEEYIAKYRENNTSFEEAMKDVENLFGLVLPSEGQTAEEGKLVLTDYEVNKLKTAYDRSVNVGTSSQDKMTQEEYVLYGTYEPFSVTITHILNNKSGVAFTSYSHTGLPVSVFAKGSQASLFEGYYDNTDIFFNLARITGVK